MDDGVQFSWVSQGGIAVVHPPRDVDLTNADHLEDCCEAAVDACGPRLVVDLADTTFVDSTVLGVFVAVAKRLEAERGWLRLARVEGSAVRKVLEITKLDAYLGNYSTVEEAIRA